MKIKHFITAGMLCLLVVLLGVFGLTACSDDEACAHEWGEWTVTAEPTCAAAGAQERTCSVCTRVQKAEIAAKGHDWSAATCTAPKTCKVCAATEGEAAGHIGGLATCKEKAVCTICGTAYGEIDPTSHVANGAWTAVSSTKHSQTCADCNTVYEKTHVWSNGRCVACAYVCEHTWVGSVCTNCGANCNHQGGTATCTQRAVCEICNRPYGEVLPHAFTEEVATAAYRQSAATCETAASYYYSCACGATGEGTFSVGEPLGHTYGDWTSNGNGTHSRVCVNDASHVERDDCVGGEATCTEKAICTDCHTAYGEEPSHAWDNGTETKAPTCLGAGEKTFACSACTETKTEPIAALGHSMDSVVTEPTCTEKGYTTHTCTRTDCTESYTDTEVDALDHDWDREPDCENGSVCRREGCNATQAELGHSYQQTDSTPADCENPATITYTCSREGCDDHYTENDPDSRALGHNIENVTPSKRLKEGESCIYLQIYICKTCQHEVIGTEVVNHDLKAAITTPATCKLPGIKTLSCINCEYEKTEDIPADATGHSWALGEVAEGATERVDTCEHCQQTRTVVVYNGGETNAGNLAGKDVELNNGTNINLGNVATDVIGDQNITLSAGKTEGAAREELGLTEDELKQLGDNPVYDFTITGADGNPISQFGETNFVTITLPYTLAEGEDVDNIAVWYINDEGGLTSIKATYNNGYVTFQTNHFSYYTVTRLTPAERCELYGHVDSTKTVEGDCLHDSYTLTVCARCHRTEKTITATATGHNYVCVTTPAGCTTAGENVYTCQNGDCTASYKTKIPATGHSWVESENLPATCAAPGRLTKICEHEGCNASNTVTYAQLKHVFTDTVIAPTCEAGGYTLHDCDNCDYSYSDTNVAAIGHSYTATFVWDGTESAVATLTCEHDAAHSFEMDATVTSRLIPSTCPAGNRTEYTAKVIYNGVAYTDVSAVQSGTGDHQFNYPKYDENGHWNECICGAKDTVIAHTWGTPTVVKNATCAEAGESISACECGATKSNVIPATGEHVYDNGYCIECGAEHAAGCDHTDLREVTYDLADYGCCGGVLVIKTCDCGQVVIPVQDGNPSCKNMEELEEEEGVTPDGKMYMYGKAVCSDCGLVYEMYAEGVMDGCTINTTYTVTLSVNNETILSVTLNETNKNHRSERVTIELSEYGCCGGGLVVYRCSECGEITEVSELDPDCDDDNTTQYTEVVDGITYMVMTMTCPDCGLVMTQRGYVEVISPCEQKQHATLIVKIGDTVLVEYSMEMSSGSQHEWEYTYTKNGTTCEEGWSCTQYCAKCETTRTYSGNSHDTEYVTIDLKQYGMCGGSADAAVCRMCKQTVEVYNINDYDCQWSYQLSGGDVNDKNDGFIKNVVIDKNNNVIVTPGDIPSVIIPGGSTINPGWGIDISNMTATCVRCGTVRQSTHTQSEKDATCKYTVYDATTYSRNGETLFSYERTGYGYTHAWGYNYQLNGSSCEDGGFVTRTCADCGETDTNELRGHETMRTEYNMSDYGACGGQISTYVCPCGQNTSFDWNFDCKLSGSGRDYIDDNGISHMVEIYTCENCALVMTQDRYYTFEGCYRYYHNTVTVKIGDTVVLDSYVSIRREENHTWSYEYSMRGTSCKDGVDVTMTCTVCSETSKTYWEGHNTMSKRIEMPEGSCGGYIETYACACGAEGGSNYDLHCKIKPESTTYTDKDGVVHTVNTGTCAQCGLTATTDEYFVQDGCYLRHCAFITVEFGGVKVVDNVFAILGSQSNHDYIYDYRFMGERDCEQGVFVITTCANCDYHSEYSTHSHNGKQSTREELANYGGCNGYIVYYSCPCGKKQHVEINSECELSYTTNEYLDPETGAPVYTNGCPTFVEARVCHKCGLRYQQIYYTLRDAATCRAVTHYSVTVVIGPNAVTAFEYETTETAHDFAVEGELLGGEGSSCEEGVRLTYSCKDCGHNHTDEWHSHQIFELERIELDQYGSVCHGYAVLEGCLCGAQSFLSLEHALCELDRVDTELWIENADTSLWYEACIYTCAVTDPDRCGLKIRYADYYQAAEPNSCIAYRYQVWQLGYNEQDGTWQREITIKTKDHSTNHSWSTTYTEGTWEGGTTYTKAMLCSVCGSSNVETTYYDTNGYVVKREGSYDNTLNNNRDHKHGEWVYEYAWYESKVTPEDYIQYTTRNYQRYVRSNGSEYWYEYIYTYDFTNGCYCTETYSDSDGANYSNTNVCHNTYWTHIKNPTCTQDGERGWKCRMCGEITSTERIYPEHCWIYVTEGHYFCAVCGLENANGASGAITMEDLTAQYGNGTHYVIGYYANNDVQFSYYVALITPNGEEIFIEVEVTERDDVRALTFSKEAVQAAAEALGLAEYDVRFTFVPYGADGSFDYAITLTEYSLPTEITGNTSFLLKCEGNSELTFTVTTTEAGTWAFFFNGGIRCAYLYDSNGECVNNTYGYEMYTELAANATYTLAVSLDVESDYNYGYVTVNVEGSHTPDEPKPDLPQTPDVAFPEKFEEAVALLANAGFAIEEGEGLFGDVKCKYVNGSGDEGDICLAYFENEGDAIRFYKEELTNVIEDSDVGPADYGVTGYVVWIATNTGLLSVFG